MTEEAFQIRRRKMVSQFSVGRATGHPFSDTGGGGWDPT